MHNEHMILSRLHAEAHRRENKTHSVEEQGGDTNEQPGTYRHPEIPLPCSQTYNRKPLLYSAVIISVSYPSIQSTACLFRKCYGMILYYYHIIRVNDSMKNTVNQYPASTTVTRKNDCSTKVLKKGLHESRDTIHGPHPTSVFANLTSELKNLNSKNIKLKSEIHRPKAQI